MSRLIVVLTMLGSFCLPRAWADDTLTDTSGSSAAPPSQAVANMLAQSPEAVAQAQQILNADDTQAAASQSAGASQNAPQDGSQNAPDASNTKPASKPPAPTTASEVAKANEAQTPWAGVSEEQQGQNDQAFQALVNNMFPLSPRQIDVLHHTLDQTQRAQAADPDDSSPTPVSTSVNVDLSPGSTPPVIRLSRGFVSSLVFIDLSGAPWQIESYDIGNPTAFNIVWDKKSNTMMIQAHSTYTYGNMAVKLAGLNTPVMLTLVPGQKVIDYRIDLRIQRMGPHARLGALGNSLPEQADQVLLNVLDAVPPDNAKALTTSSNVVQVWLVGDKTMYLRTPFTLLSPGWVSKMSSADGMNAYQLPLTPMLLVSRYGKVLQIKIEGL